MKKTVIKMQKVQNVSNFILLFFVLLPLFSFSQKTIEGKYKILRQEKGQIWYRFHEGIFERISQEGIITSYGKGHYTLTKDSLFLNFDLTEIKHRGYHILKPYENTKDSIQIDVTVYDLSTRKALPHKVIHLFSEDRSFETNTQGKITIKMPQKKESTTLEILGENWGEGYLITNFSISQSSEIEVFLNEEVWGSAIKNVTWKYKIKKFKKDYIELQSKNGSILKLEEVKIKEEDDPFE